MPKYHGKSSLLQKYYVKSKVCSKNKKLNYQVFEKFCLRSTCIQFVNCGKKKKLTPVGLDMGCF